MLCLKDIKLDDEIHRKLSFCEKINKNKILKKEIHTHDSNGEQHLKFFCGEKCFLLQFNVKFIVSLPHCGRMKIRLIMRLKNGVSNFLFFSTNDDS